MSIATTLRKAAQVQEKIETLREKLVTLLAQARTQAENAPLPELPGALRRKAGRPAGRGAKTRGRVALTTGRNGGRRGRTNGAGAASSRRRVSPLKGKKRAASPSGPLAPAVVKVLGSNKSKPMNVRDILDGLIADGYKFTTTEPKKNLAARIYRLKGVRQVGEGLFAAG